jgi:hypothetical protein
MIFPNLYASVCPVVASHGHYSLPLQRSVLTVAERSEACTVFARSEAGIVVSNPTQGMYV